MPGVCRKFFQKADGTGHITHSFELHKHTQQGALSEGASGKWDIVRTKPSCCCLVMHMRRVGKRDEQVTIEKILRNRPDT